jgi:hypothetical protein
MKIALYAGLIATHHPQAIIVYSEYSFTSSLLTDYCRSLGIQHINVLHGEKMFNVRDAFATFDRFYVWDDFYRDLFIRMRMDPEQFKVELPRSIYAICKESDPAAASHDCTYYLGGETRPQLLAIASSLQQLKAFGYQICIRYHPRYGDAGLIRQIFADFAIENPREVSLTESFQRTRTAMATISTTLYQAFLCGKTVVIDDVSDQRQLARQQDLGYIMLIKPHLFLSDILSQSVSKGRSAMIQAEQHIP